MMIHLKQDASAEEIEGLTERLEAHGLRVFRKGDSLAVVGSDEIPFRLEQEPCVKQALPFQMPFKLASREWQERSVIDIQGVHIGGEELTIIAGPCSVESEEQIHEIASHVAACGATILRGGAFKPRTSPYAFQGLQERALFYLQEAGRAHGLLTVSEVMDIEHLDRVAAHIDILQVGSRNMQNFSLLKRLGQTDHPIMLKRGASATYQDLLMAAEYILSGGNERVILCERGIRTFEPQTRNTLDLAAVPILHGLSHLPVIVDPSHGTGLRELIAPMSKAAVAAGADGVMIEVHPDPDNAISDGMQTIDFKSFKDLMHSLAPIAQAVDRSLSSSSINPAY